MGRFLRVMVGAGAALIAAGLIACEEQRVGVAAPGRAALGMESMENTSEAITACIGRLGSPNEGEATAARGELVRVGRLAMPALVSALGDRSESVRADAAQAIREILARDPGAVPNREDMGTWLHRQASMEALYLPTYVVDHATCSRDGGGLSLRPGEGLDVTVEQALATFLPDLTPAQRDRRCEVSTHVDWSFSGERPTCRATYQLDDYTTVRMAYFSDMPRSLFERPALALDEPRPVVVKPPENYTGVWTNWYVNGEVGRVERYSEGRLAEVVRGWARSGAGEDP